MKKRLGKALRARRMAAGMSQTRLAELSGYSRSHVGQVEKGQVGLTVDSMMIFCRILECTAAVLCRDAGV